MTMNYCGKCGSANGTTARFCRQCGTELNSQVAFSSQSAPLNVEFSTKTVMKETPQVDNPMPQEKKPVNAEIPAALEGIIRDAAEAARPATIPPVTQNQTVITPPQVENARKNVSRNPRNNNHQLRRVRTKPGSLITEGTKRNQNRAAEIVPPGGQGLDESSGGVKSPVKLNVERQGAAKMDPSAGPQAGLQSRAQALAQTAANTVATIAQSAARRTSEAISSVAVGSGSSISSANASTALGSRVNPGAISGPAQFPVNGPASVLVQASGLKPQSFGSKFSAGVIILAILVAAGTYFIVRDNLLGSRPFSEVDKVLVRAEEQSEQLIKTGEQELKKGNYDVAIEQFHRALILTPNSQQGSFLLGITYVEARQEEEALKVLQSLLRSVPEHLDARLQVAEIYRARGNWDAAYKEFQRIIAFDQNSKQARNALDIIEKTGLRAAEEASDASARNARDQRQQKKNSPVLPKGITANVGPPIMALGVPSATSIGPPAAVTSPDTDDNPDPRSLADIHKKLGVRYLNIREYYAAINEFLSALRLTPDDKDLYYFIGSSYNGLNQPATAHDYYRRVDSGPYVGPARSGARLTERAWREDFKRREQMKNEVGTGAIGSGKPAKTSFND